MFGLAVVATVLWCGYWVVASRALQYSLTQALAQPGMPLQAEALGVAGFPNRFDVTLTAPRVDLPGFAWAAPFAQVFALSYRPHHVIAVFPPVMDGLLAGVPWRLASQDARASVIAAPTRNLELDRTVVVLDGVALTLGDVTLGVDALRLAARLAGPATYDAVAEGGGVIPDARALAALDPSGALPRRFDVLRMDIEAAFDAALDLGLAQGTPLPPPRLALTGARAAWPGADLRLTGRVDLDAPGGPTGDVVLSVDGWADVVDRLARAGFLSPDQRAWVEQTVPALTRADQPQAVDIPLRVDRGQVRLGAMVLFDLNAAPALGG